MASSVVLESIALSLVVMTGVAQAEDQELYGKTLEGKVWSQTPETAISRVAERVRQGGHAVSEEVIRRRFVTGREHFETLYKPIVSEWLLYDNVGEEPVLLASGENP